MKHSKPLPITNNTMTPDIKICNHANNIVCPACDVEKRIGYKTFRGMVTQLKKINKDCKKKGIKLNFTIQLPIKY